MTDGDARESRQTAGDEQAASTARLPPAPGFASSGGKPVRAVEIRPKTVLTIVGLILLVLAGLWIVSLASRAVILIMLGVFFTLALSPAVAFFERRGLGRGPAVAVVFLLLALVAAVLGFVFLEPLVTQVHKATVAIPKLITQTATGGGPLGFLERDFQIVERIRQESARGPALIESAVPAVANGVIATVTGFVVVGFLTIFMLLEGDRWVARLLDLVPAQNRPRWQRVARGVYDAVTGFVSGSVIAGIAGGAAALIVMLVVGAPYPVPLALLTAVLELIPLLGPVIATLILTLAAVTQGVVPAIVVLGVLTVYHVVEGHTLRPLVYGRNVKLSPLAVLIAILVGTELGGVLGAIGAIPLGGSVAVLLNELLPSADGEEELGASSEADAEARSERHAEQARGATSPVAHGS